MKEITIAIQGNFKKYEQVIEELEKLGGINKFGLCGMLKFTIITSETIP
jgi:hypothetical protein